MEENKKSLILGIMGRKRKEEGKKMNLISLEFLNFRMIMIIFITKKELFSLKSFKLVRKNDSGVVEIKSNNLRIF